MSEKLSSDLRNWILSLGFDDRNFSLAEIEEEFSRLSPPEMRDIWRNIMNHVLPISRSQYIKKVLLFQELKILNKNRDDWYPIKKNVDSIKKLQRFKTQKKVADKINNYLKAVEENRLKVDDRSQQIFQIDEKLKALVAENSERSDQLGLIELKILKQEQKLNELFEIHSLLTALNSSWQSKINCEKLPASETLKDILRKIHELGRKKNCETYTKVVDEQELLMTDVVKLTSTASVSELHKSVICLLRDTLSALLKLSGNVSGKNDNERCRDFNSKVTQIKNQAVELFMENITLNRRVEKVRNDVEHERLKLMTVSAKNYDESSLKNFEMWLDSESLKHRMTTRYNYLTRKEESLRKMLPTSSTFCSTNYDRLFKSIVDCKNQMMLMEQEVSHNLLYLSDEPINSFIECQNYCKNRIDHFIKSQSNAKSDDFPVKLKDSFSKEITLLKNFNSTSQHSVVRSNAYRGIIPENLIAEFTKRSSFYVYLMKTYNEMRMKIEKKALGVECFEKKLIDIQNEEDKLASYVKKLVSEAKNNLKCVEEHSNSCLKNYKLWTKSSVNEIVPPQIFLADRNFIEWLKRYSTVIQCLRKQQVELSKFE